MSNPDQRLDRIVAAFVRQEFGAPMATIVGVTEILIEDACRNAGEPHLADLERIRSAGRLLERQLESLVLLVTQDPLRRGKDFRATLRHDLRTPLNAVKGYCELIIEEPREAGRETLLADLSKVLAAAEELLGKTERLADLAGRSELEPSSSRSLAEALSPEQVAQFMQSFESTAHKPRDHISGRILVVDDTEANRELLSRRLSRSGHSVQTAEGGKSALQALAKAEFDLVLLDLMMPDMNGLEVLTRLKENPAMRLIPVMMISALDEIDSIVRCIEAGAEDYISKPFDPVLLGARIEASLERKRLRDRELAFTTQLEVEKRKTESLILNILPEMIVRRIRQGEVSIADRFSDATILFSDLVGFTTLASRCSPSEIVQILNRLFLAFDRLAKQLGLEKIKTIGDAYMVAGGIPEQDPDNALAVAEMALGMIAAAEETAMHFGEKLEVRIGIHSGEVVAGLIGQHRSIYDVWGDTVNTASRLESSGLPNHIQMSEATYMKVKEAFACEPRGVIELKGKGAMPTYFLRGKRT